jgi:hypothetical protein
MVATQAGTLREADGHDRAVLDLSQIAGCVAVIDAPRAGWDAGALARGYNAEPLATARGLRFAPVAIAPWRFADEPRIPNADLAARHDDPERIAWLAEVLVRAPELRDMAGVLFGPWLGISRDAARELSVALGKPVGETLSRLDGVAATRFARARGDWCSRAGVTQTAERVVRIEARNQGAAAVLESGAAIETDAVILACGGLIGRGVVWSAPDAQAWNGEPGARLAGFTLSLDAPARLGLRGAPLCATGSPEGALFAPHAWSGDAAPAGIERIGVLIEPSGRVLGADGAPIAWLLAAGDLVADAPRTMLQAIGSGLSAGALAARG